MNKISYIVILVLIGVIVVQRSCCANQAIASDTIVITDTIWKTKRDTKIKTVTVVKKEYINDTIYSPGETIDTCKSRFNDLLEQHLTRTIYSDTLKLDSLGTIVVKDTVWKNKLYGKRQYITDYKIPYVTKTIIQTQPLKRQLYIGGNLFGDRTQLQNVTPGVLYKTRKDHIYQANVGIDANGNITYGFGSYWKIKLK